MEIDNTLSAEYLSEILGRDISEYHIEPIMDGAILIGYNLVLIDTKK